MKVLIINEFIAPTQSIASIRWTKIAKYLKKYNIDISVLTNKKNYNDPNCKIDRLLEKDMQFFDFYMEADNSWAHKLYYKLRKLYHSLKRNKKDVESGEMRNGVEVPSGLKFYFRNIIMFHLMTKFLRHIDLKSYDVVISSFGPVWTHLLAEKIKKKTPDIFWIADFRDPYPNDTNSPFVFRQRKQFCLKHFQVTDLVTIVDKNLNPFTPENVPVMELPNGYDPEDWNLYPVSERKKQEKFVSLFTGTIYTERDDLSAFFQAISELITDGSVNRGDISIEYAGMAGGLFISFAKRNQLEDLVVDHGFISRNEVLSMQRNACVLLQAAWNTKMEHCKWTGKMYEYMMAGRPIAYIMSGDTPYSDAYKEIGEIGGVCYEKCRHEETFPELKKYLFEKYTEWKKSGDVTIQRNDAYIKKYSYENIAEQIWDVISKKEQIKNEASING